MSTPKVWKMSHNKVQIQSLLIAGYFLDSCPRFLLELQKVTLILIMQYCDEEDCYHLVVTPPVHKVMGRPITDDTLPPGCPPDWFDHIAPEQMGN